MISLLGSTGVGGTQRQPLSESRRRWVGKKGLAFLRGYHTWAQWRAQFMVVTVLHVVTAAANRRTISQRYLEGLFVISEDFLNLHSLHLRFILDRISRVKYGCLCEASIFWNWGQGGWCWCPLKHKESGSCWGWYVGREVILRERSEGLEVG